MSTTTTEAPAAFHNAAARPGPFAMLGEAIGEVASRRRLLRYLVQADIKKRGVNTLLGNLWWVLDPLLLMTVYLVLVTVITSRSIPDYPLFLFAAILPWKWFTVATIDSANSVVSQTRLVKQIAFPKIVLPIAATTAGVVGFIFGLIPLGAMFAFYPERLSWFPVFIPVIAMVQFVFTLALGILVAAGNVFVRDLGNVLGHLLRLWWYLSPGLYSIALLSDHQLFDEYPILGTILMSNPFAVLLEAYRAVLYGTPTSPPGLPDFGALGLLLVASVVLLAISTLFFKRVEPTFAKVL
jgi:lipopolysaccharide transport system permease protein/teichoic acid transport system permease protein